MNDGAATDAELVNESIRTYFAGLKLPEAAPIQQLTEAMLYSAGAGGKRFRPVLSLLIADVFGCARAEVLPFALAVEMIHTYSLIHDDLPSMDNDDFRRGKPTSHKVYGEATALLAGDSLLTEAFLMVAEGYQQHPENALRLTKLLSLAAGLRGMVGGQAVDLQAKNLTLAQLTELHELKTGRLIQVAAEGAAIVAGASVEHTMAVAKFGATLGLAFQVADDILDQDEKDQGPRSFVTLLGLEGTKKYLNELSQQAHQLLLQLPQTSPRLQELIEFNRLRNK
jgi:geranylgeranyl diphosphate synthase type II